MYDFKEHVHRYAVWTAARAVQRAFVSTDVIQCAIEKTELREYAEKVEAEEKDFEAFHRRCSNALIREIETEKEVTYGRAAKIIAIYLKTAVILSNKGECHRSKFIHPPIDSILLRAIAKREGLKDLSKKSWTTFSEDEYWRIVDRIRTNIGYFNWKIEEYWKPVRNERSKKNPLRNKMIYLIISLLAFNFN